MKSRRRLWLAGLMTVLAVGAALWFFPRPKRPYVFREEQLPRVTAENDRDLQRLGDAVGGLLATGDVQAFAVAVSPTAEDWAELLPKTAGVQIEHPLGDNPAESLRRTRSGVTASAAHLLEIAQRNGAGAGRVRFKITAVDARAGGTNLYRVTSTETVRAAQLRSVRIQLVAEPVEASTPDASHPRWTGAGEILIGTAARFPGGWKIKDGLRWTQLPAAAIDDTTRQELAFMAKVGQDWRDRNAITAADDPALTEFGEAFIALLRQRAPTDFARRVTLAPEELRALDMKLEWGPPEQWGAGFPQMFGQVESSAQAIVARLDRLGVDLSDATIRVKKIAAERVTFGLAEFGSPQGLRASPILVTLEVQSQRKAANGRSVSGDYEIEAHSPMRRDGRWIVLDEQARWKTLPSAIMTRAMRDELELENHVSKQGALPVGMMAPDIEFIRLADGTRGKLADFRGKVVVLEFWASWCGPCQEPMTRLQETLAAHPEWRGRAEVLTISIDDTLAIARAHVAKRAWTKTPNTWAGEGALKSAAARPFRLNGIPQLYVIDAKGKIVAADHPMVIKLEDIVAKHLP